MFFDPKGFEQSTEEARRASAFTPEGKPEPYVMQGFADGFAAAWENKRYSENSSSRVNAYAEEIKPDLDALRSFAEADGFDVANGFEGAAPYIADVAHSYAGVATDFFRRKEEEYWEYYENLRSLYPQAGARSKDEITRAIAEKAKKLKTAADARKTVGGAVGAFVGEAAAAMTDPINLWTTPLPAGSSFGLGGRVVIGAASAMFSEAMIQPSVKRFKNETGVEYTIRDGLAAVGMAGVGGGAFPAGIEAIKRGYGVIKRIVGKHGTKANVQIRAADRAIAEKELTESTNPYDKSDIGGQIRHAEALSDATGKMIRGDDIDDGVRRLRYIDEDVAAATGGKAGYLQLKTANVHPLEKHLKEIQSVGFDSVEDFSDFVAQNFDGVYKDSRRPGRFLFVVSSEQLDRLNVHSTNHTNSLVVEAMIVKDAGVFDIVSAFPKRTKDFKHKKNLLLNGTPNRSLTEAAPEALTRQKQILDENPLSERAPTDHLQETPKNVSLTGQKRILDEKLLSDGMPNRHITEPVPIAKALNQQKQISYTNIRYDGRNVQPVSAGDYKITTRYEVVDLDDLKTSDAPDYPAAMQPRDRSRQASADQVGEIARRLDPDRLGRHTDADRGAPVVSPDGVVESGNGRTMAIRRAYAENPQSAARYRAMVEAEAKAMGVDISGMKRPVLIRRRLTVLNDAERLDFTRAANRSSSLAYSTAEHAALDADRLSARVLDLYNGGDLRSAQNAEFVRQFRRAAVSGEEAAAFQTADGTLSRAGEERISAALFAKAYGDKELAGLLFEEESNIKSIGAGLRNAAIEFARLKEDVKAGYVGAEYDIAPDIVAAVNAVRNARAAGETVADYVAQADMFSGGRDYLRPILKTFFRDDDFKRPVSAEKVGEALTRYAEAARAQNKNQLSMFDVAPKPAEIIDAANAKVDFAGEVSKTEGFTDVSFGKLSDGYKEKLNFIRREDGLPLIENDELIIPANVVKKLREKRILHDEMTADQVADMLSDVFHKQGNVVARTKENHIQAIVNVPQDAGTGLLGFISINPKNGATVIKSVYPKEVDRIVKNYAEVKKALDERGSSSYVTGENPPAAPRLSVVNAEVNKASEGRPFPPYATDENQPAAGRLSVVNAENNIAENAAGVNRGAITPAEIIDNGLKRIAADDAINGEDAKAAADFLRGKESTESVGIDGELTAAKASIAELSGDVRAVFDAQIDAADIAEKLLNEAATCKI